MFHLFVFDRIVPYINPLVTGSISGIIGAGGNVGAVIFGIFFREFNPEKAFVLMGIVIMISSILSLFICIEGQIGLFLRTKTIMTGTEVLVSGSKGADTESDLSSPRSDKSSVTFPIADNIDEKP